MNKDYYRKYLKYKKKYLELKGGTSTQPRDKIMPLLSFGPKDGHESNLSDRVLVALTYGYRHIDIKSRYSNSLKLNVKEYLINVKEGIQASRVPRDRIWITWNGGKLINNEENIQRVIDILNCKYIDTIIGNNGDLSDLAPLKDKGLVNNLGVENIYDFEKIKNLQELYGINTLQIQAHIKNDELIKKCNEIGIKVQLYGILSSFTKYKTIEYNSGNFDILENPSSDIIYLDEHLMKYYMIKYLKNKNVIISSTLKGPTIIKNMYLCKQILNGNINKDSINIENIETILKDIGDKLPDVGEGTLYK